MKRTLLLSLVMLIVILHFQSNSQVVQKATIPESVYEAYTLVAPDGSSFACRYVDANGTNIVINDKKFGPFYMEQDDEIFLGYNASFGFRYTSNDQLYYQTNAKVYGPFQSLGGHVLSTKGSIAIFNNRPSDYEGPGRFVNVNDNKFGPYKNVLVDNVSSDGTRWGYSYIIEKDAYTDEVYMKTNTNESGPYLGAYGLVFAESGTNIGYSYKVKKDDFTKESYAKINDKTYGPYFDGSVRDISFSSDGSKFAFIYIQASGDEVSSYVQVNDKTYGPFLQVRKPVFSGNGASFGFYLSTDSYQSECSVQINEKVNGPYYFATDPVFSSDGSAYIYACTENVNGINEPVIRTKDKRYGPFSEVLSASISQDGKRIGFIYKESDNFYIQINAKKYGPYTRKPSFALAADATYIAFIKGNTAQLEKIAK